MREPSSRRAFALLELPAMLILLFASGLLVAFVFSLFVGPAPWYAWIAAGAILPVIVMICAIITVALEKRTDVVARKHGPSRSSRDAAGGPTESPD